MWVSTPTPVRTSMISRPVDFWMLGGASLLVFAMFWVLRHFSFAISPNHALWIFWAPYLRIGLEYPHLFTSYKLAYAPSAGLVKKHPIVTILAPLLFLGAAVYFFMDGSHSEIMLLCGIHALLLGFGWHRFRQVWGCMMIYAKYDGFTLDQRQRDATKAFLTFMWLFGYCTMMRTETSFDFFGIQTQPLAIPDLAMNFVAMAFGVSWIYFVFEMMVKTGFVLKRLPSLNFMVSLLAGFFWLMALCFEPAFFIFLAPSFHALQYLNVAWAADETTWLKRGLTFGVFIAIGFVLERLPQTGWIAVAYVGLSLHHYLLDRITWRSDGEAWKRLVPAQS